MTVIDIRTVHHMSNGGTVEEPVIREWPSVMLTIDGDITFMWQEFRGSRYWVSSYSTDGPWDEIANPRNPLFALRQWR